MVSFNISFLIVGIRFRGEFEEWLKKIMDEICVNGNIILVIDEIYIVVGVGVIEGSMDVVNIFKFVLVRGEL